VKRIERKWVLPVILNIVGILILSTLGFAAYREFLVDIHPLEAIDYFRVDDSIPTAKNAAFALRGIVAPARIEDFHEWGYERWLKTRGASYSNYTDSELSSVEESLSSGKPLAPRDGDRLELAIPADGKHYLCWQPDGELNSSKCVTHDEILGMLETNALPLERYTQVITYDQADFVHGPGLRYVAIEMSRQFSIRYWLNRKNLVPQDLESIARQLHFWRSIIDNGYLGAVDLATALVSYHQALVLFHEVSKRYPGLLGLYRRKFGNFTTPPVDQALFDRLAISAFYAIDDELCLGKAFGYPDTYCREYSRSLLYKPGRTINLMFQARHRLKYCSVPADSEFEFRYIVDPRTFLEVLRRPGNYVGRLHALLTYHNSTNLCDLIANLRRKNEVFALYRLYLNFADAKFTPAQVEEAYVSEREIFRIPGSERYFKWNKETKSIVMTIEDKPDTVYFELPYPGI